VFKRQPCSGRCRRKNIKAWRPGNRLVLRAEFNARGREEKDRKDGSRRELPDAY